MRVGFVALLIVTALGCGDDDGSSLVNGGFSTRDASLDAGCLPYYLSESDRSPRDAGPDAGDPIDSGAHVLSCDGAPRPGVPDLECADILWTFAGGEEIELAGCCNPDGACGVIDPTGVLGCIPRDVFPGHASASCTPDAALDAGDDDASAPTT